MFYYSTEEVLVQRYNPAAGQYETDNAVPHLAINFSDTVDVVDFDGETYTLNHVQSLNTQWPDNIFSYTEHMNSTGYSTWIYTQTSSGYTSNRSGATNPALTGLLARSEVTVGETWVIPINMQGANDTMTGNMSLTFVGIQDITVPAGTFKVFRVDSSSNDTVLKFSLSTPWSNTTHTTEMYQNISGINYIDFDTGRQIESYTNITLQLQYSNPDTPENSTITSPETQPMKEKLTIHTQLMQLNPPGESAIWEPSSLPSPAPEEQAVNSFLTNVAQNKQEGAFPSPF